MHLLMVCGILHSILDALEHAIGVFGLRTSEELSVIMNLGSTQPPDGLDPGSWTFDPHE